MLPRALFSKRLICSHCNVDTKFYVLQSCNHALCEPCWVRIKTASAKSKGFSSQCPKDRTPLPMSKLGSLTHDDFHYLPVLKLGSEGGNAELAENEAALPPSTPVLSDALECTICLDPAASPIHQCENGHIVCGFCAEKMEQCGLCETNLQVSVLAERQSRQFDLKCNCINFESGCVAPLPATEAKKHVEKCYYRDAICESLQKPKCDKITIPFKNFPAHLQTIHGIPEILDGMSFTLNFLFPFNEEDFARSGINYIKIVLKKHGEAFLFHFFMEEKVVHLWATVLGNDKTAEKHWYQLNIKNHNANPKKMDQSYTMPVLPYHGHSKFDRVNVSKNCVSLSPSVVSKFGLAEVIDEVVNGFTLPLTFGIV